MKENEVRTILNIYLRKLEKFILSTLNITLNHRHHPDCDTCFTRKILPIPKMGGSTVQNKYHNLDDAYALNSIVNHFQTSLSICVYAELTNTFQCN